MVLFTKCYATKFWNIVLFCKFWNNVGWKKIKNKKERKKEKLSNHLDLNVQIYKWDIVRLCMVWFAHTGFCVVVFNINLKNNYI